MSNLALKMDYVSKLYQLGQVGTGTLSHDLNRWWAKLRGKEDPYSAIGATNNREQIDDEFVWALRDINFEVKQGEIVGIIGRNGAGKSTLLKLLSRVTGPTKGEIHINGKIASLLEVGTGFHPELTGRENIFLNGAILGMSRQEIYAKFDEIVEFSGCAKYIDTPVKRYSSGMHVRLAFAVAGHLEPDILIVDEVLAVGDAEFQSKCLGKMQDVSKSSGRTVLFVSHNMGAVKRLCPNSILLEMGTIVKTGSTSDVVDYYLDSGSEFERLIHWSKSDGPRTHEVVLNGISVVDEKGKTDSILTTSSNMRIEINYTLLEDVKNLRIVATVRNVDGTDIFSTSDYLFQPENGIRKTGSYKSVCHIPENLMTIGSYVVSVDLEIPMERAILMDQRVSFHINELTVNQLGRTIASKPLGVVHPLLEWDIVNIADNSI
jgi:homopolymeric O-antigen transport system ATP-binding protein